MEKQNITIEVPQGKVAKQVTNPDGSISITFVDKESIRSKSWSEFCKNHPNTSDEWYVNSVGSITTNGISFDRANGCNNHLATKEDAEGILALIQLTRLHDEWVKDSEYKKFLTKAYIYYCTEKETFNIGVGESKHLLDFPSSAMAKEFLECFEDLILKAKKFL